MVLAAVAFTSCATQQRETWQSYLNQEKFEDLVLDIEVATNGGGQDLYLDRATLEAKATKKVTRGRVTISFPSTKYARGSRTAASWLDGALRDTERDLGVTVPTKLHLALYPVENQPRLLRARYEISAAEFLAPVVLPAGKIRAADLLEGNFGSLVTIWHEIYEMLLIIPWVNPTALPDGNGRLGMRSKNYTRWFRDGFATYAAYVTLRNLQQRSTNRWPPNQPFGSFFYDRPFSALDRVGAALFRWDQYDSDRKSQSHYSASFGLFLLIEDRYGIAGVRRLLKEVSAAPFPDGAAIRAAAKTALGRDLAQVADAYTFPESARLIADQLEYPGGAIESVKVGTQKVDTVFDFERAIERARHRAPTALVEIQSSDRTIKVDLPLR